MNRMRFRREIGRQSHRLTRKIKNALINPTGKGRHHKGRAPDRGGGGVFGCAQNVMTAPAKAVTGTRLRINIQLKIGA